MRKPSGSEAGEGFQDEIESGTKEATFDLSPNVSTIL